MECRPVTLLEDATLKNFVYEVELAQARFKMFLDGKNAELSAFVKQMGIPEDQNLTRNPQSGKFECVPKPAEEPKKGKKKG